VKSSPTLRMTLGLVLLTTCQLFVAQQLGLMPSEAQAHVSARAKIAESLAVQIAAAAEVDELEIISTTLDALTQRTPDILSAGLRESDGTLLVEVEEHQARWPESAEDRAPGTHATIPIFKNGSPWATLELRFAPLESVGAIVPWAGPHFSLIVFIALTSFLVFFLFLRRTLRYLDPSSVVPTRVHLGRSVRQIASAGEDREDTPERLSVSARPRAEEAARMQWQRRVETRLLP
jgi:hypothetical protein